MELIRTGSPLTAELALTLLAKCSELFLLHATDYVKP